MSLNDFLAVLKSKWYLLIIFPIVFAAVTAIYCWCFMPNVYSSSVTMYALLQSKVYTNTGTNGTVATGTKSDFTTSATVTADVLALAKSTKVMTAAAQDLGVSSLGAYSIDIKKGDSERVIKLVVTGSDPQSTADAANAIAKQVQNLAIDTTSFEAINIIDEAKPSYSPSGPPRLKYVGIAALIGLLAALVLIILLDMLNTTVRSADEAEKKFSLPVMGNVPYKKLR